MGLKGKQLPHFILVRHGETTANIDHREYGKAPYPSIQLTANGIQQALITGKTIENFLVKLETGPSDIFSAVLTNKPVFERKRNVILHYSPFCRAKNTAKKIHEHLGKRVISFKENILLRELSWGQLKGKEENEFQLTHPDFHSQLEENHKAEHRIYVEYPGGDSQAQVIERTFNYYQYIKGLNHSEHDVRVVVAHHWVNLALAKVLLHQDIEWYTKQAKPDNGSARLIYVSEDWEKAIDYGYMEMAA